jgi:hypothetical protein
MGDERRMGDGSRCQTGEEHKEEEVMTTCLGFRHGI